MTPDSPDPSSPEGTPLEIEPFDPEIHVSPHALFRWLKDAAEGVGVVPRLVEPDGKPLTPISPLLLDPHPKPLSQAWERGFHDSEHGGGPRERGPDREGGQGGEGPDVVLIDRDGTEATRRARELRAEGHEHVYALYGGLELYDYALDPLVVGEERFLI